MKPLAIGLWVAGLLVLAFGFQGSRGIWLPDEGCYIPVGQAMVETGDYLLPRLNHDLWLDKPPLSMWGVAAGLRVLGRNEWGARSFHALSYVLTTLVVFALGRAMLGGALPGFRAALCFATMLLPVAAADVVTPDTPLTLWITAAFFCFWKSASPETNRINLWKMLLCIAFGLGFLTKGPAALIPALPMFVFLAIERRLRQYFVTPWAALGLVLFAVVGLSWYAYLVREVPGALAYVLDNQLIGRTLSSKYSRQSGLFGSRIYLVVLLLGTLPWAMIGWVALWQRAKRLVTAAFWRELRSRPAELLLVSWIVCYLAVLVAASSKLVLYVLPIFPAIALVCARVWPSPGPGRFWQGGPLGLSPGLMTAVGAWVVILLGIKATVAYYPNYRDMRALAASIRESLPSRPYVVVCVEGRWDGLSFYLDGQVERVTTRVSPYPFFVPTKHLEEKADEMRDSRSGYLFICRNDPVILAAVRAGFDRLQIPVVERALPFNRRLLAPAMPARQ
jgi:4-amino-4-deoxy-L-arabinose transferase-like glycosyltransferase